MPEKLTKAQALYFKPGSINRPSGARCGACWKFILTGACCEVRGEIDAAKVCGLYVNGTPFRIMPDFVDKITRVSKEEAGYGDGDTHCVNCENMLNPRANYSPCKDVEGMIEPEGCCDVHEFR